MIRNYFLSALRNLWRNKFITLINLLGMAISFGIFLLTGLLAGLYPALKITGFQPLSFFTGKWTQHIVSGARSRRVLIVVQFAFSILFITTTIFVVRQFNYLRTADLGFNRNNVLYIRTKGKAWDQYPVIKQELEKLSFVKRASSASDIPVQSYIFVRVDPGISSEQLAGIVDVFHKYNPGYEVEFDYVRNYNYPMLENSDAIGKVFRIFSASAIFIAIMGLIGLSQFNNTRRTKEMGIHKVMGAQTGSVIRLLLSEFMKLVILSNLVALPLSYLGLKLLFGFFSYSTELKIQVFIMVFLLSVVISLTTVMFHALRTARSNPVNSLRYE